MQTSDIIKLVNAGFTKQEILSMTQPQLQQTNMVGQPQLQQTNMVGQPQVDYKMLYETQKQMLADMQVMNQRMNTGAPIDTVESVMKDFLGGEK